MITPVLETVLGKALRLLGWRTPTRFAMAFLSLAVAAGFEKVDYRSKQYFYSWLAVVGADTR